MLSAARFVRILALSLSNTKLFSKNFCLLCWCCRCYCDTTASSSILAPVILLLLFVNEKPCVKAFFSVDESVKGRGSVEGDPLEIYTKSPQNS